MLCTLAWHAILTTQTYHIKHFSVYIQGCWYVLSPTRLKRIIERSPFFVRRGGHCCCGDLVGRTNSEVFLSDLQKLTIWSLKLVSFLVGPRAYQHPYIMIFLQKFFYLQWFFTNPTHFLINNSGLVNPYPTAFPYGNGMVLHFYQQQESSTTKTVHKVINKRLKTYV